MFRAMNIVSVNIATRVSPNHLGVWTHSLSPSRPRACRSPHSTKWDNSNGPMTRSGHPVIVEVHQESLVVGIALVKIAFGGWSAKCAY